MSSHTRYGPNHQNKQIFEGAPPGRTATESTGVEGEFQNVAITDFDFDSVDQSLGWAEDNEDKVDWKDMSACFSLLLSWMCGRADSKLPKAPSITGAGWRAHALLYLLDNQNARYRSLQEIADAGGVSRAMVSRSLVELREELGGIEFMPMKRSGSKESYQKAQRASIAAGVHSRYCRKDRKSDPEISLEAVAD
jgi:biotin operon repressor